MTLIRALGVASLLAVSCFAELKVQPAGAPPAEASAVSASLVKDGVKVVKDDGSILLEMWVVASEPKGGAAEQNTTWSSVGHGSLLGVVKYPVRASDRRGQGIKPGTYTMRYSYFPMNGDHQGVAPQRDFALLSPVAADTDAAAKPAFDALVEMSKKASGTPHPLVLSIWKEDKPVAPGIEAAGETDQVLHVNIGSTSVSIIVVGKAEG
ncbi:hypothetical protein [uncultured Paludibaculum sp.]|uniref:hypothetical protein n=1 Tax=uncultured Paludibaculum sp. TaxID=1765020 RepID=UPI002AAB983C|nr:hypothetical protein [uncultured Paludibaculum sp.]